MNEYWMFIKLTLAMLVAVSRVVAVVAPVVLIVLLLYIMWTGGDIKNIHVAVIILAAVWSVDNKVSPAESKPKERGKVGHESR